MAYLGDFNVASQHGRLLRQMLDTNELADLQFARIRDVIIQMRAGDGSQLEDYSDVVKFFGYGGYTPTAGPPSTAQLALAKASFDELDSAYSKTSGDGPVENVRSARNQLFAKHRG